MHTRIRNWKARRAGAAITITGDTEGGAHQTGAKVVVNVIEPRDGKLWGVRHKPLLVPGPFSDADREVEEEFELLLD